MKQRRFVGERHARHDGFGAGTGCVNAWRSRIPKRTRIEPAQVENTERRAAITDAARACLDACLTAAVFARLSSAPPARGRSATGVTTARGLPSARLPAARTRAAVTRRRAR